MLGAPPAFVLSQDQTLSKKSLVIDFLEISIKISEYVNWRWRLVIQFSRITILNHTTSGLESHMQTLQYAVTACEGIIILSDSGSFRQPFQNSFWKLFWKAFNRTSTEPFGSSEPSDSSSFASSESPIYRRPAWASSWLKKFFSKLLSNTWGCSFCLRDFEILL